VREPSHRYTISAPLHRAVITGIPVPLQIPPVSLDKLIYGFCLPRTAVREYDYRLPRRPAT
jgi:hypothetical protein